MESYDLDCLVSNELIQGMESAKKLKFHLLSTSPPNEARELLLRRIICSYEKALAILKRNGSSDQAQPSDPPASVTVDGGSPRSENLNAGFKGSDEDCGATPKKRKLRQATWTERVRVNSDNGLEGPSDDGFSWRKYGQKDILGAKYPRSYYRCTYRSLRNCWATKQVQRSDEDPSVFEVTYKGAHSCAAAALPRSSPEGKIDHRPQNQTLVNLKANLRVNTGEENNNIPAVHQFPFPRSDSKNHFFPSFSTMVDDGYLGSIFVSPETSESNYFSGFEGLTTGFEPVENSIISGHASTSNSPIGGGMEFAGESFDLIDSNFCFDSMGSFSSF